MKKSMTIILSLTLLILNLSAAMFCPDTGETIPGFANSHYFEQSTTENSETSAKDVNSWSGTGPWGGNIRYLTTDPTNPNRVFAASGSSLTAVEGGVYYSIDGGINWLPTTLPRKAYNTVAASASEPGVFYAGARNGLYKTTDYGITWQAAGQSSSYILGLGVQANNGNIIVMGKSGNQGFLVSNDGGTTFNSVGVNSGFMRQFAWHNNNPQRMYVVMGSSTSSVLTSVDNGQTWTDFGPAGDGWGMYASPTDSLFCLVAHANGIYRTTDGGLNWTNVLGGTFRNVTEFNGSYFASSNAGGIFESNDQGLTWQVTPHPVVQSTWQAATSTDAGALFGHWGGIFRVTGYQQPIVPSHTGINLAFLHGLAYYADTNELWGGAEGSGLYCSTDNGLTWEHKVNGLNNWMVYELQPTNHLFYQSGRMLVGTLDGAYTSMDGGNTWSCVYFQGTQVSACEVHPTNPNIFWLGSASGEIKYTTDGGQTFNTSGGGYFGYAPRLKLGKAPDGNYRLFLCFQGSATAIWYSDDGGANFVQSTGLESTTYQPMVSIRPVLGTQPQIIYASTNSGVYKSTDYGATYSLTGMTGFSWSVLAGPGQQVVSGKDNGVSYSTDEGTTATSITQNLESNATIWQIAWGTSTNQVYIATRGRGILENRFNSESYLPPTNLTASPMDSAIFLNWTAPTGTLLPISYIIWRDAYPLISIPATQTSYTDSGLINGQEYKYYVSAVYDGDIHTTSIQIITAVPAIPVYQPIANLTAEVSNNDVILNWTAPEAGETGYKIYRDSNLIYTITDPSITHYTDTGLTAGNYLYAVTATYPTGESAPVTISVIVVSCDDPSIPGLITELKSCYPNPFQTSTSIHYSVKEAVPVEIRIYNARGELVHKLVNDNRAPGNYNIIWDGRTQNGTLAPSGIYFYQMKAGNFNSQIKKLLLMK